MIAVNAGHREVVEILLEPSHHCQVNLQEKVWLCMMLAMKLITSHLHDHIEVRMECFALCC